MTDKLRKLDTRDVAGALAASGLAFTLRERRQMLRGLDEFIIAAKARRAVNLPNSAPMALRFDPRLGGFAMPVPPAGVTLPPVARGLPDDDADIAFAGLPELGHWIASRQLTSRRLTEIYLARIAAYGARLSCFATVTPDLAVTEADARDAETARGISRGPLHGIPYGLKDIFDTAGIVTGWGAEPFADRVPDADAAIVTKLRAAGAVLLGKTTVGALAYGDRWYGGQTRNPWNPAEGSSGSSAGSASATAAGLCAFAIGTETLGSIVSPAERCGTTGLRPTFGRVSRAGAMALCWSLDKVGPITRGVADCALVMAALNGGDPADRDSIDAPFGADLTAAPRPLRVGYLKGTLKKSATGLKAAIAALQEMGHAPREVTLPDLPYEALNNIVIAEAAAAFEDLTLSDQDDLLSWQEDAAWPNLFRQARLLSAVDHIQLDRLRWQVMAAADALFQEIDILIGPPFAGPMLVVSNFTGHPCLHLRAGFSTEQTRPGGALVGATRAAPGEKIRARVPHGVSLWSGLFDEHRLLQLGAALESALGVASDRPKDY